MERERVIQGWVPLIGIPAFFLLAFVLGLYPRLVDAPFCGVKLFAGIPCPGCGLTHAMVALVHGNLRASIDYHPLAIVIALWLVYQGVRACVLAVTGKPLPALLSAAWRMRLQGAFIAALMLQWLVGLAIRYLG